MRAAKFGVFGAISAGEFLLSCLGEKLSGELERAVLFLVQVVSHLRGELTSDLAELIRRGIDASKLLDELLRLVMVGERVATGAESCVHQEERNVQVALLGGCVGVEFLGERKEGGASAFAGRSTVCHRAGKQALHLVAGSEIVEDRHVDSLASRFAARGGAQDGSTGASGSFFSASHVGPDPTRRPTMWRRCAVGAGQTSRACRAHGHSDLGHGIPSRRPEDSQPALEGVAVYGMLVPLALPVLAGTDRLDGAGPVCRVREDDLDEIAGLDEHFTAPPAEVAHEDPETHHGMRRRGAVPGDEDLSLGRVHFVAYGRRLAPPAAAVKRHRRCSFGPRPALSTVHDAARG